MKCDNLLAYHINLTYEFMGSIDNLSAFGLFLEADLMVKLVLFMLLLASVFSWAFVFHKLSVIKKQIKYIDDFEEQLFSGQLLDKIYDKSHSERSSVVASVFVSGLREFKNLSVASDAISKSYIKDSVVCAMNSEQNRNILKLEDNMDLLATVASVSPFLGLLGTVWGIINSFKSIAAIKSATLVTIAPSIAEALFATAVGLLVAIPASVFYNRMLNNLNKLSVRLTNFITDFSMILIKKI